MDKRNVKKKKHLLGASSAIAIVASVAGVPLILETPSAEASYDASKVNLSLFIITNVSGGVSLQLTEVAKTQTTPIHVPSVVNGRPVIGLGDRAFEGSKATQIIFEDSSKIASIGRWTFNYAAATNAINLPSITTVPENAFHGSSFESINIDGSKITSITDGAFGWSRATNEINLPMITKLPPYAFYNSNFQSIKFNGSKIASIGAYAFDGAKATNVIDLPMITSVPTYAFYNTRFSGINLDGSKITSLGLGALGKTQATNSINLTNITSIPNDAFHFSNFATISFGDGSKITSIGEGVFKGSKATNPLYLPRITVVPNSAFASSNFSSLSFGDGSRITSLGSSAFEDSKAINPIALPMLSTVPDRAFYGSKFESINLNSSRITSIGDSAFANSVATNVMNLPMITAVPNKAFAQTKFSTITLDGTKVRSIGDSAFAQSVATNVMNLPLVTKVPAFAFDSTKFSSITLDFTKITDILEGAFNNVSSQVIAPTEILLLKDGVNLGNKALDLTGPDFKARFANPNNVTFGTLVFGESANSKVIVSTPKETKAHTYAVDNNYRTSDFDDSQVDLSLFIITDVEGGISLQLTEAAKSRTKPIYVPNKVNGKPVIGLGNAAFQDSKATAIIFEDSSRITNINSSAFSGALATNEISLPNIETVPPHAFRNANFSSISFGDGTKVTSIGAHGFIGSKATNELHFANLTSVGEHAFNNAGFSNLTFEGSEITSIGESAFSSAKATNAVNLPMITHVPNGAFENSNFSSINLDSEKIVAIGTNAFKGTKATNAIDLSNISVIPQSSFEGSNFKSITFGDGNNITEAGVSAFKDTKATNDLTLPNITSVSAKLFENAHFNTIKLTWGNISAILGNAFYQMPTESIFPEGTVTLKDGVSLGVSAFELTGKDFTVKFENPNNVTFYSPKVFGDAATSKVIMAVPENSVAHTYAKTNNYRILDVDAPTIVLTEQTTFSKTSKIDVTATDTGGVTAIKWDSGVQTAEYFATAGKDITAESSFTVDANGVYTVYATDAEGNETVETIEVNKVDNVAPTVTLTEQTGYGQQSEISVAAVDDLAGIKTIKWASGVQTTDYFANQGTDITNAPTFLADDNGAYTVYVVDHAGNETLEMITVAKVNSKPVVETIAFPTFTVIDNTKSFTGKVTATDVDGQALTSTATVRDQSAEGVLTDGHFEFTFLGNQFSAGVHEETIQVIANDGLVDSAPNNATTIVIHVEQVDEYNRLLDNHVNDSSNYTLAQHEAFYQAYTALLAFELAKGQAEYTAAANAIRNLQDVTVETSDTITEMKERIAMVLLNNAEESFAKDDFIKVDAVKADLSQVAQERVDRLAEYHTTSDLLLPMEEEVLRHQAEPTTKLDTTIITLDALNDIKAAIALLPEGTPSTTKSYYEDLMKRYEDVREYYFQHKDSITIDDLAEFDNVDPSLEDMYNEFRDMFDPLSQEAIDYVNLIAAFMKDVNQTTYDAYHMFVTDVLATTTNTVVDFNKVGTVTAVIDATYDFRITFRNESNQYAGIPLLIDAMALKKTPDGTTTTQARFNQIYEALKTVVDYNQVPAFGDHSEEKKALAEKAIEVLVAGQFKTDMTEYLSNGVPKVIFADNPYEYIVDGTLKVTGAITDDNEKHDVTVMFNGETKTFKGITTKTFEAIFADIAEGVYVGKELSVTVHDGYTSVSIQVPNKPVISVSDPIIFTDMVKSLENDQTSTINTMTEETLTNLLDVFQKMMSMTPTSSLVDVLALYNQAEQLSGQSDGQLETYVRNYVQLNLLEWIYENYETATVEVFNLAGVEKDGIAVVTPDVLDPLKVLIDEYKVSEHTAKIPSVNDYVAWVDLLNSLDEFDQMFQAIYESNDETEIATLLLKAQQEMQLIPNWSTSLLKTYEAKLADVVDYQNALGAVIDAETVYTQDAYNAAVVLVALVDDEKANEKLSKRLESILTFIEAEKAVVQAETNLTQQDKDTAQTLVDALKEGTKKDELNKRLEEVQKAIDKATAEKEAENAVEKAEGSLTQQDKDAAQILVDALEDGPKKDELNKRLDEVQKAIDKATAEKEAENAVEIAEGSLTQQDKDTAQILVDALEEGTKKVELNKRLEEVQKAIDKATAEKEAEKAVEKAEGSLTQQDKDAAQILVDALEDGPKKDELNKRLDEVQKAIDKATAEKEAEKSVEKAEGSLTQEDKDAAQILVDALEDGPKKDELNKRLEEVQKAIDKATAEKEAEKSVEKAEGSLTQEDKDAAQILVDALEDGPKKDELNKRLDEVQKAIDKATAEKEAEKSVEKAEGSLTQQDKDAAQILVDAIEEGTKKDELNKRLDEVQKAIDKDTAINNAEKAVEKAEGSLTQQDKDTAQILVDALEDSPIKDELNKRLDEVQKAIDKDTAINNAEKAVEKAEGSLSQKDKDAAQELVDSLEDGPKKDELNERLEEIQKSIDKATAEKIAEKAVEKAESSLTQKDKNDAQELVDSLEDGPKKDELNERLEEVQKAIDKKSAEDKATDAVIEAEKSWEQDDLANAKTEVEQLPDGSVKEELLERIKELEDLLLQLESVIQAVEKAEQTKKQVDSDNAQTLLNDFVLQLKEPHPKVDELKNRIDEVNRYIIAEKAVTKAEGSKYQRHLDEAQLLVDGLKAGADKDGLQARLDALQQLIDEKESDIPGRIVDGNPPVTGEELKDYTDETVYEELVDAYLEDLRDLADEKGELTKDDIVKGIVLRNAFEIAKREMTVETITNYQTLLESASSPMRIGFPEPYVMFATAEYLENDLAQDEFVKTLADLLQRDVSDVQKEIDTILAGEVEAAFGSYTVNYVTEEGEEIHSETFEEVALGEVVVQSALPEGYEIVGDTELIITLSEENPNQEVIFTVKKAGDKEEAALGSYTVNYVTEEGEEIHSETFEEVKLGEVVVQSALPEGYGIVGDTEQIITLSEENPIQEVIFTVKKAGDKEEEPLAPGSYNVKYVTVDGKEINNVMFTDIPIGEVTVQAEEQEGYEIIGDTSQTIELTEEILFAEIIFTVQELVTKDAGGTEVKDDVNVDGGTDEEGIVENPAPEVETPGQPSDDFIVSDTVGEETALVRSLLVASLDTLQFTHTPVVTGISTAVGNEQYLYHNAIALVMTKAYELNPTQGNYDAAKQFIVANLEDGLYKQKLLALLNIEITDIGQDGKPDLTPIQPKNPTLPPIDNGNGDNGGNGGNATDVGDNGNGGNATDEGDNGNGENTGGETPPVVIDPLPEIPPINPTPPSINVDVSMVCAIF